MKQFINAMLATNFILLALVEFMLFVDSGSVHIRHLIVGVLFLSIALFGLIASRLNKADEATNSNNNSK